MTPVEFPDVELWATDYLRAALNDSSVLVSNIDRGGAGRRVIVRRDGGPQTSPATETARLGVRVFAPTEQDATDLARRVRAHLAAAANHGPARGSVQSSGPAAIADPSGVPLRYFFCEITFRGQSLA